MNITEKIKELRKKLNLTQEKLSEKIGVSAMTVRRWEWGDRIPRANELEKLAQALGTTAGYLLGETENAGAHEEKTPDEKNNLPINNTSDVSEDDLDLGYWGAMAQRAKRVAKSEDKSTKEIIGAILKQATEAVTGAGIITGAESNSTPKFVNIQSGSNNKNNMSIQK